MSVKYSVYQDKRKGGNLKWYGRSVHPSTVDMDEIAERVQRTSSAAKGDVIGVLKQLVTVMRDGLTNSQKVTLDGLGTFKLTTRSIGANTKEEFTAAKNIKHVTCTFLAEGKEKNGVLVRSFTDGVTFEKMA